MGKLLILQKNKTNPTILRCYKCKISHFINTPHFSFKAEGKMRSAFIIPELKVCGKCESFFMDIDKDQYWEFPKDAWKKKFKTFIDLEESKNKTKLKSLTLKRKGDLRKLVKCQRGHKLKLYDYKCESCSKDVAILPL